MSTIVKINKFEPLTIECPEKIITPVELFLPELRITIKKLDMDGLIPDAPSIVSDGQFLKIDITTEEPEEIPYDKFMEFIFKGMDYFKDAHAIAQRKFDEKAVLD